MDLVTDPQEKLAYPKSIWFIVLNELCERFSYYGLRTVLVLYLTTILKFDGDESTIIYHTFVFMAYFMPLSGAILADSYWGKFDTIIRLSLVYALGNIVLTGASMADPFGLNIQKIVSLLGLFFIAVGTGGIKPCVFTFGGDQFQLPQQTQELLHYTTKFIIAINVGSLVSTFLTPELRENVHCLGKDTCFPLAFALPAVLMLIAIVIFISGKNMYVKKKPEHDVISRTFGCIFYALRMKVTSSVPPQTHWLDNAKGVYTETEITDTKMALQAITVFMTFPMFWALYEQQGSRWTLQATLMNGHVDFLNWTIKPDQMQTVIPFFGLILLVLFDVIFYPLLAMVGIRNPLQKLTLSGIFAIIAFIFATLLQLKIFGKTTVISSGEGRLNIYNGFDCNVFVRSSALHENQIGPLEMININYTTMSREDVDKVRVQFDPKCTLVPDNYEFDTTVSIVEGQEVSYYLTRLNLDTISLHRIGNYDGLTKDKYGNPKLRLLLDHNFNLSDNITLSSVTSLNSYSISALQWINYNVINAGKYNVIYNEKTLLTTIDVIPATFYTIMIQHNSEKMDVKLFTAYEGNYIHIMWQLPQFLCMNIADVIFIVTSTEYSFTEAPTSIKSFISATCLLTTAIGNLLVVIISTISISNQVYEYLLYIVLMGADTLLMAYFSIIYQHRQINKETVKSDITSLDEIKKEITPL